MGIGIGEKGTTRIRLLCDVEEKRDDGSIVFWVINGAWKGVLHTNGDLYMTYPKEYIYNQAVLYEGPVIGNYNDEIPRINALLESNKMVDVTKTIKDFHNFDEDKVMGVPIPDVIEYLTSLHKEHPDAVIEYDYDYEDISLVLVTNREETEEDIISRMNDTP